MIMSNKWFTTSAILLRSEEKLNEIENKGFKIIEVKQYKAHFGGQDVSIIYRKKHWYEKLLKL